MTKRAHALVWVAVVLGGCGAQALAEPQSARSSPPPAPVTRTATADVAPPRERDDEREARAEPPLVIGLASVPAAPDEELEGVRAHIAAGDLPAASARLGELLATDLPRYRRALETERALAALRSSPHAGALRERIAAVEAAWRAALPDSVPIVMFGARADSVRGGLYVPSTRRLLPVGSPMRRTVAALVVPRIERVVVLTQHGVGGYAGRPNISAAMYPLFGESGSIASAGPFECNECAFIALPDRMRAPTPRARTWSITSSSRRERAAASRRAPASPRRSSTRTARSSSSEPPRRTASRRATSKRASRSPREWA